MSNVCCRAWLQWLPTQKNLVQEQTPIYTVIAVVLALIVLMLTMDSFIVPILFLVDIGMTIIYNLGSNFVTGEISFITMSLVAILQLGVTMDYSIFLYHSYVEHKVLYPDKKEANGPRNCRDYHFCRRFFSDNHSRLPRNVLHDIHTGT